MIVRMDLEAFDHVALNVTDVERSIRWYQGVLGLRRAHEDVWGSYPAVLEAGGSGVALFPCDGNVPAPTPGREDVAMGHLAFRTSRVGFESAKDELTTRGIEFAERDHRVSWSIYIHDPDGYEVEITTYQPAS